MNEAHTIRVIGGFSGEDSIQGPTGTVYQDGDVWRWKAESAPQGCESEERAHKEMRAALDGASVIEGRDLKGNRAERRNQ